MKVVVFGASGFIGANLVRRLEGEGFDVIPSDLRDPPFAMEGFVRADIRMADRVNGMIKGADVVVDLAAGPLARSIEDPVGDASINVMGTLNLLEASRRRGIEMFVFTSASSVVGHALYNPVDEDHPCIPRTPYGAAKLACEHYIRIYGELYGLNYLIFRLWNVYGPWQMPESGALIPSVMYRIMRGEDVTVFGDGRQSRDFIYVGDVVGFIADAVKGGVKGTVVNLGSGRPVRIIDVIRLISKVVGREARIVTKPRRPGEIGDFYADVGRLKRLFGRLPSVGLEEGLKKTYEWMGRVVV